MTETRMESYFPVSFINFPPHFIRRDSRKSEMMEIQKADPIPLSCPSGTERSENANTRERKREKKRMSVSIRLCKMKRRPSLQAPAPGLSGFLLSYPPSYPVLSCLSGRIEEDEKNDGCFFTDRGNGRKRV